MSLRFSLFSYIENLETRILVLTDPFQEARKNLLFCRYETLRQGPESLAPDESHIGLARWHRYLPYSSEQMAELEFEFMAIDAAELPSGSECHSLFRIRIHPDLPYLVALPGLRESGNKAAFAFAVDGSAECLAERAPDLKVQLVLPQAEARLGSHENRYTGSAQLAWQQARFDFPGLADLGPWGNPYRLEGYKCLGLELFHRHPQDMPVLVVDDPSGELLVGLILAAELVAVFYPERVPYRIVALQRSPFDPLAQRFEGRTPDWSVLDSDENRSALHPPEPMPRFLVQGIQRLLGTLLCIDVAESTTESADFEMALARLVRTGFVDEEDTVYLLR